MHAGDRATDRRHHMVIARRNVGHERTEQVERGAVGQFFDHPDVVADLVGRDMPRPLDHPLHSGGERPLRQVPERQYSVVFARRAASTSAPGRIPSPRLMTTSCSARISSR